MTTRKRASLALMTAAVLVVASLAFPLWVIHLDAPQYPEKLAMYIKAYTVEGSDPNTLYNINILNHYIGMKEIHPDSIPELKIIPPVLAMFALLLLGIAFRPTRSRVLFVLLAMVVAGAVGLADFWRWQYDYGHDLNPMAPIKVPGMSYQPPLFGSKELLNITATSLPHAGSWLLGIAVALQTLAWWWLRPVPQAAGAGREQKGLHMDSGKNSERDAAKDSSCRCCDLEMNDLATTPAEASCGAASHPAGAEEKTKADEAASPTARAGGAVGDAEAGKAGGRGWKARLGGGLSALFCLFLISACSRGPEPITYGRDACHRCKMTIAQRGFAAERITKKGKIHKFDSIECLVHELAEKEAVEGDRLYVSDFSRPEVFLPASDALYLHGGTLSSPMGASLSGFASPDSAKRFQTVHGGELKDWKMLQGSL